jgi:hypothetical protein
MKFLKNFFVFFLSNCLLFVVNANWEICDWWIIDFWWKNFDEICNWWNKINNLLWDVNLNWSYIEINPWFLWTNNKKSLDYLDIQNNYPIWYFDSNIETIITSVNPEYLTPPWFLWTNNKKSLDYLDIQNNNPVWYFDNNTETKISLINPRYVTPVWFFWSYSGQILDFWIFDNNDNKDNKDIINTKTQKNICTGPEKIDNIKIEIIEDIYQKYIKLSWGNQENLTWIKIHKISKNTDEIFLNWDSIEYRDFDIEESWKYMYFVVSYNSCWIPNYSEIININYEKPINDKPYLYINKKILHFYNYKWNNIKLKCLLDNEIIIDNYLNDNLEYLIPDKYLDKFFHCYANYYDNNKLKMSNIVYNIKKQNFLTVEEWINYIHWQKLTKQELFEKLYYLFPYIELSDNLNYYDLSLLLINIYGNIIIEDKELSFKILNEIGLYNSNIWKTQLVYFDELLILLSKINSSVDFKNQIISSIWDSFYLNNEKVFNDLLKIYYINTQLKNENILNKKKLISCLKYEWCYEKDLYINFYEKIHNLININESKNLWININNIGTSNKNIITWENYINILFKIIWKDEFYSNKYNLDEYNKFINILTEAIIYSRWIKNTKLTFVDYYSLKLELIFNEKLFNSIEYLTNNYLKSINLVYEKLIDKSKLLKIIRDYLNK